MKQIRNKMKKLVTAGVPKDEINVQLKAMFPETKESVIEKIVREKDNGEYGLAQKILRSNLFTNMREKG